MPQFGKSVHWARERYYGGTFVTDADLYWVNARVSDESEIEHAGKLQRYAAAVEASGSGTPLLPPSLTTPNRIHSASVGRTSRLAA